jgi:hypothetical protein
MRPLSLRKIMDERRAGAEPLEDQPQEWESEEDPRDDLVTFLSTGVHPVEAGLRPERTIKEFKDAIERGYVHVKFTDTRGGTELGFRIKEDASDLSRVDFEQKKGVAHLVGDLTLNYVRVRCVADIDVETLAGEGLLEVLAEA